MGFQMTAILLLAYQSVFIILFLLDWLLRVFPQTPVVQCCYPDRLQWFCEYISQTLHRIGALQTNISRILNADHYQT